MNPGAAASPGPARSLDLVLPAHQEAGTIEATLRSWAAQLEHLGVRGRIVVAEDGSTDGTAAVVERVARTLPVALVHDDRRLGYSEAMVRGLGATTAEVVVCADADGQCDPADLATLLARWEVGDVDVVVGRRAARADGVGRRLMSWSLRAWYRRVHGIALQDPSSPFVVGTGDLMRRVASPSPTLAQGYWWEFHVHARRLGARVVEVPVDHRPRLAGPTRVYRLRALGPIAASHLVGIWRLRDRG